MKPLFLIGTVVVGATAATGIGIWAGSGTSSKVEDLKEESQNNNEIMEKHFDQNQKELKQKCEEKKSNWIEGKNGIGFCSPQKIKILDSIPTDLPPSPESDNEHEEDISKTQD